MANGSAREKMSVAFFTKTWGKDYPKMLQDGFERKWQSFSYDFDTVGVAINNEVPPGIRDAFLGRADIILDVPKMQNDVLEYFNLKAEDFKGGFFYSIAELAAIRACDTEYLCYLQGDCLMESTNDFVARAIDILENDPRISVVSPASDVNTWHNTEGLDQFFSDQCFVIRIAEFQKPIYEGGEDIPEYPSHGGDSFEKKVAQYLRRTGKYRKIITNAWYDHPAY